MEKNNSILMKKNISYNSGLIPGIPLHRVVKTGGKQKS